MGRIRILSDLVANQIAAGTRTKFGATNFMRLHMVGEHDPDTEVIKPAKKNKTK